MSAELCIQFFLCVCGRIPVCEFDNGLLVLVFAGSSAYQGNIRRCMTQQFSIRQMMYEVCQPLYLALGRELYLMYSA